MADDHGGAFYDRRDVAASYLSHRFDPEASPNLSMEDPAVWSAVGNVVGKSVLDLGCGDGTFGHELLEAGASSYLGVDGSKEMIERAVPRDGLRLELGDVERFDLPDNTFDLITARMVLHYLAELGPIFAKIRASLRPDGRFLFSVVHPVITSHAPVADGGKRTSWTVDEYFERGPRSRDWFAEEVRWHHRTVEDHVVTLHDAGFELLHLSECEPDPRRISDPAELERRRRVQLMLLMTAAVPRPVLG